jgi:hypothetical protein
MPLSRLIALIINAHPSAEDGQRVADQRALTKRPDHSEKNPAPAAVAANGQLAPAHAGPGKSPFYDV